MYLHPGLRLIDTMMGGMSGVTAAYLVESERPTLIETGPQTSVPAVLDALAAAGVAADDLASIVLTHIHLDHCGGVGDLARAFPGARIVVHRRGARHLAEPERLITSSNAVYGELAPLYGGLAPVDPARIDPVDDGDVIDLGGGRSLVAMDAPGHARHQMAWVDSESGAVFAGDALGVMFDEGELYPAVPPPQFDLDAGLATLATLADRSPPMLLLGHFGAAAAPETAIAMAAERQRLLAEAALAGWRSSGSAGVADAVAGVLPFEAVVRSEGGRARWRALRWLENNDAGLADWAARTLPDG